MIEVQFHLTRAGRTFYERTVPELVRQLTRVGDLVERLPVDRGDDHDRGAPDRGDDRVATDGDTRVPTRVATRTADGDGDPR